MSHPYPSQDAPGDFEDVLADVTGRIFSAPTQFEEPKLMSELTDFREARRVVREMLMPSIQRSFCRQDQRITEGFAAREKMSCQERHLS